MNIKNAVKKLSIDLVMKSGHLRRDLTELEHPLKNPTL